MTLEIRYVLKTDKRREQFRPDVSLPFGKLRSEHMFLMDGEVVYEPDPSDDIGKRQRVKKDSEGNDVVEWRNARIVPYGPLTPENGVPVMPGATVLNYGQGVFEGAKAFEGHLEGAKAGRDSPRELYTFRLDENALRLNRSAARLCAPRIPVETQIQGIHALLDVDRLWFPQQDEASLYIRPLMIGTNDVIGVHESKTYTFMVFLSPSGPYYPGGFNTKHRLMVTDAFHRAAQGGTGAAKAIGNYAGSFLPARIARERFNAQQVVFLNVANTDIDEAGAMNHFHVTAAGEEEMPIMHIPKFNGTVLPSITTQSITALSNLERIPVKVIQHDISLEEFIQQAKERRIISAGGLGTAAVISEIGEYFFSDSLALRFQSSLGEKNEIQIGGSEIAAPTRETYKVYTDIQRGRAEAPSGWMRKVERME